MEPLEEEGGSDLSRISVNGLFDLTGMAETSHCGGPARDRGAFTLRLRLIVRLGPVERETELRLNAGTGGVADKPVGIGVASKKGAVSHEAKNYLWKI